MGEPKDDVKGLDRYGEKRRPWFIYDDEGTPVGLARVNTDRCDPRCSTSPGRCVHRVPVCLSLEHRLAMAKEADAEAEQHRLYRLKPGPRPGSSTMPIALRSANSSAGSERNPMKQPDCVKKLAAILFEELEKDAWVGIDPVWIGMIADGLDEPEDPDDCDPEAVETARALKEVLKRVVKRLNLETGKIEKEST